MRAKVKNTAQQYREFSTIRPADNRGRLTLSSDVRKTLDTLGISHKITGYKQFVGDSGEILLVPVVEVPVSSLGDLSAIPERERWVYENPDVLTSLERGIEHARQGQVIRNRALPVFEDDDDN